MLFFFYVCKYCKNPSIIQILVERYPINITDEHSHTALFYSIDNPNIEISQTLIDNKIDIDRCDDMGNSVLIQCILNKNMQMIEFLLKNNARIDNALESIISMKDNEILKFTLPYLKSSINKPNSKGQFILDLCIIYDYPEAIIYIQSVYPGIINPNLFSKTCPHPLHFIFTQPINEEIVKELIKIPKINLNIPDSDGNTPLIKAVQNKNLFLVDILSKDQRCDIDRYNNEGLSALYIAVVEKEIEIVKKLIENGALVDQPISNGETPLSFANKDPDYKEISDLLIENGAIIDRWSIIIQDLLNATRPTRSTTIMENNHTNSKRKSHIQRRLTQIKGSKRPQL